ncbi:GNAT family N-acetyltransferase [Aliagarivorans marinus]|uniref:GNAT family N-acetyltransferase n=1 Tax=Aliagarivorans marinus TaxID=561965 RepID=UPI000402429C|nr:GNAT family N-acetyltransferase [Aliagarivorans marinus]
MEIKEVKSIEGLQPSLQHLLADCVESGASVGFLTPVEDDEISRYWSAVEEELKAGARKLFVALDNNAVQGAVQLSLCGKANGAHRGEVEKLMVHTQSRGRGLSKRLMDLMEQTASALGLSLLVLDTRLGDVASSLYQRIGYTEAGQIPQFARSSTGELEATVYFYKLL